MKKLSCFKAYDVRGIVDEDLNEDITYRIGRSFVKVLKAKIVVVGRDNRPSSTDLIEALIKGLLDEGADVLDLGLCGTEEVYFATSNYNASGGIEVTASHNPIKYNGLKMIGEMSRPLDLTSEFLRIKEVAENDSFVKKTARGQYQDASKSSRELYIKKILSFVDPKTFKENKIVVNSGNGAAGPTFDEIDNALKKVTNVLEFERIYHEPNSKFPYGVPNPMLKQNQLATSRKVIESNSNFGIAFDGDFDRCFFFDENGDFVSGEYIVCLIAEKFLRQVSKETIVHDPRVVWSIQNTVSKFGGRSVVAKTGHAFFKRKIREINAIYGGEMSAHHYFRDFCFSDSGMIPWLVIVELLSKTDKTLSEMVESLKIAFSSSGEINFKISNPSKIIEKIYFRYKKKALLTELLDGISVSFEDWRFNLRASNTEDLVRLNVETRGNHDLLQEKTTELTDIINNKINY